MRDLARVRINRAAFREILARARTIEPRLSDDPTDYAVARFGLKGEVVGEAEIGYEISVTRP